MDATADENQTHPPAKERIRQQVMRFLPASPFKRGFTEGVAALTLVMILLFIWMGLRAERTAENMQSAIPVKTAVLETVQETTSSTPTTENVPNKSLPGVSADEPKARDQHALPAAPIEGLTEPYGQSVLPISRAKDDLTPFEAYKKPFVPVGDKPLVSIVVVDYGLSASTSQRLLDVLPDATTLVLSPYAGEAAQWGVQARANGHEFWLSLPMQAAAVEPIDTGPLALQINASLKENNDRLFAVLSSAVGYAGLVSQENHAFISQDMDVSPVMKQIFGRGLAFAESNPVIPAYGLSMAMEFAYPYVQNTFWLDESLRPADIDRALRMLEQQARTKGKAVAFIHPYPVSIQKVQAWMQQADSKNIQLAPLSAMVQ